MCRERLFQQLVLNNEISMCYLALEVKKNNPGLTDDDFKDKVQEKLIQNNFIGENDSLQAGYRGLIVSKKMGLIKKENKSDWFHKILEKYFIDRRLNIFMNSLSDQMKNVLF